MKILTVVGARPNFMKAAPIIAAIRRHNQKNAPFSADGDLSSPELIQHLLVHTGQHYDDLMSGAFFRDLNIPEPDVYLGVRSGSHAVQTAEVLKNFEPVLLKERPDVVVLVGDVNSTLACALATAKISFDSAGSRPLIAHVEAGLRSCDLSMPEEINRILTDHISDLHFVTEHSAVRNLQNEGIPRDRIRFVGNTMIDSLLALKDKADASTILEQLGLREANNSSDKRITRYALLTLHRPRNVDNGRVFQDILAGLEDLQKECSVVFPVHPRTRERMREFGFESRLNLGARYRNGNAADFRNYHRGIILTEPLGYLDFLCLMRHAALVVTDSGGIQEETTILGIPCVTVRETTERPVTVESGTNTVAGTSTDTIKDAIRRQLGRDIKVKAPWGWDGQAAERIIEALVGHHCRKAFFLQAPTLATITHGRPSLSHPAEH
jgi:UDP-N-acetylglucosamine 2-epimerase (non-hydrolysing)